ncbi:DnaB-like helicase C-terminal domain-containing protein [Paenibacillus sp. D2_2]|uniref:DnaB-like helicase C-terminal domain-containing protein n=1 Tax=Paenibacillus sp. D2_2 TaxID=3073092 RepID=UPI002815B528|nr:DnaB-like helicase C-terminal domain-containing protein [Paenibacillus sp. D2_2]WMT39265.1 DnaB-like helicase C-terminal domain-containing protein [Paenibacillus sp. D2_2]
MRKHGIDSSYFIALQDVVLWIDGFQNDMNGYLPTLETVAVEFEDFRVLKDLDPVEYCVNVLREQRAYMDYRPALIETANMTNEGKTLEAMWKMRNDIDVLLKKFTGKVGQYEWTKHAEDRYKKYMEKHGQIGLSGITTGIKSLNDLTGGWKNDDLVLLAGRTNEGKSWVGEFFAYAAWQSFVKANINDPIIYLSTEMPELEVAYRMDTFRAHFSNRALNEGRLSDIELYREYTTELMSKDQRMIILSQDSNRGKPFTAMDIKAIIESERPGLIVIDQLYDLSDGTGERDIRRRIINVTNSIRDVNLSTRTPTIMLAQAGRDSAKDQKKDPNAVPELHQIQESDNPAQKATRVITLRKIDDIFKLSLKKNRGGKKGRMSSCVLILIQASGKKRPKKKWCSSP